MPFNIDFDYSLPPFQNGEMFILPEEEEIVLEVQKGLKETAVKLGLPTEGYFDQKIQYAYNTYPELWDKGEWINLETCWQCWNYVKPEVPVEPPEEEIDPEVERPIEEETPIEEEPEVPVEEPATEEPKLEEKGAK